MPLYELVLLGTAGVVTAMLTAVVGYGGGAVLIGVLLLFMPPVVAIPFHGVVQLASNAWRVFLFRRHISWRLVARFALLLPVGVAVGLWFFVGLSKEAVQVLIGLFVLGSLSVRSLKRFRGRDLPLWGFVPLGFATGILNMVVGAAGPLPGVLTVRKDLTKEALVGTLGTFAMLGHICKVIAFGFVGFSFSEHLLPFAVMIPAVMLGGLLGKHVLGLVSESAFHVLFRVVLVALSLKLILWEGGLKTLF